MPKYRFHPACTIFPPLPADELRELADDIAANGLRNPIVLFQGKILDGRNRYVSCEMAGVELFWFSATLSLGVLELAS